MVFALVFYLLFPAIVIYSCMRFPLLDKIGMIIICYAAGLILGNSHMLSQEIMAVQERLSEVTAALSLPLLLFSLDLRQWLGLAGKTLLSMVLAIMSIILVSATGILWISGVDNWKLTGMAVGVYTGGTPNLAAIKTALSVDPDLFLAFHTYDIFVTLLCVIFFITVAQKFCHLFLPRFTLPDQNIAHHPDHAPADSGEAIHDFKGMLAGNCLKHLGAALALSTAIVAISLGISRYVPGSQATAVTILSITSLGIAASFIRAVRRMKKTFQLGMYLIMIFCLTVSSMSSMDQLAAPNLPLLGYVVFCVFGSLSVHGLMCRVFNIDADTFIITSASAICSPPFVPVVAAALKNRAIILSGLTTGIIGYALGNYLGISMAYIIKSFLG
ncbi:MAG: DUF819 family protein [Desulfobacter sp.]